MGRKQIQRQRRKRIYLASITRKKGMMMTLSKIASREETKMVQIKEREENSCNSNMAKRLGI
jgi:hypothetical protein